MTQSYQITIDAAQELAALRIACAIQARALREVQTWSWTLPLQYREAEVWHGVDCALARERNPS